MNMQKHARSIGMIGALIVAMGGLWLGKRQVIARASDVPKKEPPSSATSGTPRSVEVVKPERQAMSRKLDVPATLEAFERTELFAKVSGYVAEVRADIGDDVKAGAVLAVIDLPEIATELAEARAQHVAKAAAVKAAEAKVVQARRALDMARSQLAKNQADVALKQASLRRREELFAGNAIPQEQLDEARNQDAVAQAELGISGARIAAAEADVLSAEAVQTVAVAEVEVARSRVERIETLVRFSQIVAPYDGIVTKRMVNRGDLVQAATSSRTTPLFTVERVDQLRAVIDVPESDIAHIRPGVPAKVKLYGLGDEVTDAPVTRIASSLNPSTRTMRVEIDLPNPDGRLMHGMYAQVTIALDQRADALTVPASALLTEGKETFVYTVTNGFAIRTPVRVGLDDGVRVEVTDGLAEDALVVVTGKALITPGLAVRAVLKPGRC
jgi:RND family efflux transporter MFP subunit